MSQIELKKVLSGLIHKKRDLEISIETINENIEVNEFEYNNLLKANEKAYKNIASLTIEMDESKEKLNTHINEIKNGLLKPHEISNVILTENKRLIDKMDSLKLPKAVSEQFFCGFGERS